MGALLGRLLGPDLSRWVLASRCPPGPLKRYYRTDTPTLDTPYTQVEFLVIDLELTGLDMVKDEIVSIGFVPVVHGRVRLADAVHTLVRPGRQVGDEAARVHGLFDDRLAEAAPLAEVMPVLLEALTGRVAVAHHALIERSFLSRACRTVYGQPLEVPYVDTLAFEKRQLERANKTIGDGALKLAACRARHGLPAYRAHDALSDAIATAELLLAQAARCNGRKPAELRDLLL